MSRLYETTWFCGHCGHCGEGPMNTTVGLYCVRYYHRQDVEGHYGRAAYGSGGHGNFGCSGSGASRGAEDDVKALSETKPQVSSSQQTKQAENRVSKDHDKPHAYYTIKANQNALLHDGLTHDTDSEVQEDIKRQEESQPQKHSESPVVVASSSSNSEISSTRSFEYARRSLTQTTASRTRRVSSMRWFLDTNQRFEWPPEFDLREDGRCNLPSDLPIPFTWKTCFSKRAYSHINLYAADGRFKFEKTFAVKTSVVWFPQRKPGSHLTFRTLVSTTQPRLTFESGRT